MDERRDEYDRQVLRPAILDLPRVLPLTAAAGGCTVDA
jgi:hypothetical protein